MEGQLWEASLDLVLNLKPSVGEGGSHPTSHGPVIYRWIQLHKFQMFFFFYLPHCQDLINIHEFPALEYLSSCEEEGSWQREGKERVPGGIRRVSQWGERGSL